MSAHRISGALPVTTCLSLSRKRGMQGEWPQWQGWREMARRSNTVDKERLLLPFGHRQASFFTLLGELKTFVFTLSPQCYSFFQCLRSLSLPTETAQSWVSEWLTEKKERFGPTRTETPQFPAHWDAPKGRSCLFMPNKARQTSCLYTVPWKLKAALMEKNKFEKGYLYVFFFPSDSGTQYWATHLLWNTCHNCGGAADKKKKC